MTHLQCIVLVGLQASGKTAFYAQRFATTHVHVSKDNFSNARHKDARQNQMVESALAAGRSVVIDNTNATPAERQGVIAAGRRFGARVVAYYFDSTIRASIGRNRRREGKARVPDVAILATAKRMVPPSPAEGFDEIYRVRLTDEGVFEVNPAAPPSS